MRCLQQLSHFRSSLLTANIKMTPNKSGKRGARGKARQNKSSSRGESAEMAMIDLARATGSTTVVIREDRQQRRQNFNIVLSPPKNWMTQSYWARLSTDVQYTTSTSADSEENISFTLNAFSGYSSLVAAFDQYCIESITVTISIAGTSSTSANSSPINIYTAIDYDNTNTIGRSGIQTYSSSQLSTVSQGTSVVRFLRPCVATILNNSASAFNANGIARSWVDSAYVNVPHYGFRSVFEATFNAQKLEYAIAAMVGFRNSI
jgi:hypothetical protein